MEVASRVEARTASVRVTIPVSALKEEMAKGYGEIMSILGQQGVRPSGNPYALYRNMDMNALDVEMGFPVASAVKSEGRVRSSTLPGGKTAISVHKGPYEEIGKAYGELSAFIQNQKLSPLGPCYETYLNDPQVTKPEDLLTEICFPLKE